MRFTFNMSEENNNEEVDWATGLGAEELEARSLKLHEAIFDMFPINSKEKLDELNKNICAEYNVKNINMDFLHLIFGGIIEDKTYSALCKTNADFKKYFETLEWYETDWLNQLIGIILYNTGYVDKETKVSEYTKNAKINIGSDGELYNAVGEKIESKKKKPD